MSTTKDSIPPSRSLGIARGGIHEAIVRAQDIAPDQNVAAATLIRSVRLELRVGAGGVAKDVGIPILPRGSRRP